MEDNLNNEVTNNSGMDIVNEFADVLKESNANSQENSEEIQKKANNISEGSQFKVANNNLPAKVSFWTKVKNILFYEIKVELTPYQQKIENEINDFLHQEITWKSLKEAALSEVPITFRGKRIF